MKTRLKILYAAALLALLFCANIASAVYSPNLGRWVTRDPIGEQGGLNLYGFVENNSVNWFDPFGLEDDFPDLGNGTPQAGYKYDPETQKRHEQIMCEGKKDIADGAKEIGTQIVVGVATEGAGNVMRSAKPAASKIYGKLKCLLNREKAVARTIPKKATDVLDHVRKTGKPPKDYVGGREFKNKEGRLPKGGRYREYDTDPRPKLGTNRNSERIVIDENTGQAWYTDDHYGSFTQI